jgi:hypothetical protein
MVDVQVCGVRAELFSAGRLSIAATFRNNYRFSFYMLLQVYFPKKYGHFLEELS